MRPHESTAKQLKRFHELLIQSGFSREEATEILCAVVRSPNP
jgi:hypothetical protein